MPGWELKVTWFQEDSLPHKGVLSLEVYSGEGMSLQDCQVARSVRNMMMALVLPRQRNLHDEIQSDMEDSNLIIQDNASAYSLRENRLEYLPSLPVGDHTDNDAHSGVRHSTHATPKMGSVPGSVATSVKGAAAASGARTPASVVTPGLQTPLESCAASVQSTNDVVLFDAAMRLAYPQLSAFEHYESVQTIAVPAYANVAGSPKAHAKRASMAAGAMQVAQAGWVQTGSTDRYMKTYRLDDLHANLKAKTNINLTYAPAVSGAGASRGGVGSRGASRGNA
jgi:hypothetical protein